VPHLDEDDRLDPFGQLRLPEPARPGLQALAGRWFAAGG
jgi:hypothetical protein